VQIIQIALFRRTQTTYFNQTLPRIKKDKFTLYEKEMGQNTIIVNVGISGSGKSTFTAELLGKDNRYLRINRDDIRRVLVKDLTGYYQRKDLFKIEELVTGIEDFIFWGIINRGKIPVIDNTNLTETYIKRWITLTETANLIRDEQDKLEIKFKIHDCNLATAQNRVAARDFGLNKKENYCEREEVQYIKKQYAQYQTVKQFLLNNFQNQILC